MLCQCGCGKETSIATRNRKKLGHIKGQHVPYIIGHNTTKHGYTSSDGISAEYRAYTHAKTRCNNPNYQYYSRYGGRGIKFLFSSFEEFIKEVGLRPSSKYSIDRKENNGHYEVGNVRWATASEQAKNRKSRWENFDSNNT
jgi:hypothetical protein